MRGGFTTWKGMFGNGSRIGTAATITATALPPIPRDRRPASEVNEASEVLVDVEAVRREVFAEVRLARREAIAETPEVGPEGRAVGEVSLASCAAAPGTILRRSFASRLDTTITGRHCGSAMSGSAWFASPSLVNGDC
jgi:hypothetical protein